MTLRISLMLRALGVGALLALSGCAMLTPIPENNGKPLTLQRPDEQLTVTRSGRFVVRAVRAAQQPNDRGAQGQFEWMELQSSPTKIRQLLLFVNPLGQSGPSLERELLLDQTNAVAGQPGNLPVEVRIYDEGGNPLPRTGQRLLVATLIGSEVAEYISDAQIAGLLVSVMNLFQSTAVAQDTSYQRTFRSDAFELSVRIAYDNTPAATKSSGKASR